LRRAAQALAIAWAVGGPAALAGAHDFWIEPSTFHVEEGRGVALALRVGDHFRGTPVARNAAHAASFRVTDPAGGAIDVQGLEGRDPAGLVPAVPEGPLVANYVSTPQASALAGARFDAYLVEEGFRDAYALRQARGAEDAPGLERYVRCAKTLLVSGPATVPVDRHLGLPYELVASGPALSGVGAAPLVVVAWRGADPVPGARVVARRRDRPDDAVVATTDAAGRAALDLPAGAGVWLVRSVVIAADDVEGARWTSHWASLLFERRAGAMDGAPDERRP
jgi:uncharacterized GH25 family protein